MSSQRIVVIPGNGNQSINDGNWYRSVATSLQDARYRNVVCETFPDPFVASERIWLPFIIEKSQNDLQHTVLIGHSSGCEAAMRLAENHRIQGIILVSACYTDLDDENERASGYYNRPWHWNKIRENVGWIVQLGSTDDHLIDFQREQKYVAEQLHSDFRVFHDRNHFLDDDLPEVVDIIKEKVPITRT